MTMRTVVVSAGRPERVPIMAKVCDLPLRWYVPEAERSAYDAAGATDVVSVPGGLPNVSRARNQAIDEAEADGVDTLVFVDDDVKQWRHVHWHEGTRARTQPVPLSFVALHVLGCLEGTPYHLGGVAPTKNWLYACSGPRVKYAANMSDATLVLRLPSPVRYDPDTDSIQDQDFVLQHIVHHGGIVRDDLVLLDWDMRKLPGGYQHTDREFLDLQAETVIRHKWGRYLRPAKSGWRVDWKQVFAEHGRPPE